MASGLPIPAVGIIAGGGMVVIGSFLPWLEASTGFATISRGGFDGGDGFITLILGAVMIIAGVGTRRGGRSWITALIASAIALGVGFVDLQDILERIDSVGDAAIASVGIGLWLILAGGVVGAIAALVSATAKRGQGDA